MTTNRHLRFPIPGLVLSSLLLLGSTAGAQWNTLGKVVENFKIGVSYRMPKRIKRIPLKLGQTPSYLADKYESLDHPFYTRNGTMLWGAFVYKFEKSQAITKKKDGKKEPKGEDPKESELEKKLRELRAQMGQRSSYTSFESYLKERLEGGTFKYRGKDKKQRHGKLRYKYYEWTNQAWMHQAAVYNVDGRQIVLHGYYPAEKKKKVYSGITNALNSLRILDPDDYNPDDVAKNEKKYSNTPLRKKLLEQAKKSIEGYRQWDVYCSDNYIFLYSFDPGDRNSSYHFVRSLSKKMNSMYRQYQKFFPPHEGVKPWWSVVRVCRNKKEFDRYGGTSGGVIGWFNPGSKELVFFKDKRWTFTVAYHEGWHQYAHFWFPGAHLQRWFDEGTGDWFGSFKKTGKDSWKSAASKMRLRGIQVQVRTKTTVPWSAIVTWHKDKFYGPRASYYYAQAWAMIDFLRRGSKSRGFKKEWKNILPTYIKVALETKDTDKAVKEAFKGVDWAKIEESWKRYVKKL